MSAENKSLVTAADNKIAPQYYNPAADAYEHLRGKNGGSNVNVIETVLPAGAATAAKQDEQTGHLEALVAKDNATSAKQDSMIAALGAQSDAEATSGNGTVIGILKAVRTAVGSALVTLGSAIGSKAQLIAGSDGANARALKTAADGTLLTQLTGSNLEPIGDVTTTYGLTVTAGSSLTVYPSVDVSKYTHISGAFGMQDVIWNHELWVRYHLRTGITLDPVVIQEDGTLHRSIPPFPVRCPIANFIVRNLEAVDRKIYAYGLYGHIRG